MANNRLRIPTVGAVQIEMQADGDRESGEIEIEIKSSRNTENDAAPGDESRG